ncbi:MAG: MarR family transcriptional regulator [Terracoccus sp.]
MSTHTRPGAAGRPHPTTTDQTDQQHDPLESDQLVTALLTASRALVGVSARSLAGMEDAVTLTQFRTLVVLRTHGRQRLAGLADRLGVGSSTALRMVDRLVASDLVDRRENAADRREVVIELTARGHALVDEVTLRRRESIEKIVSVMPISDRLGLVRALTAFAEAADEPCGPADPAARLGW